MTTITNFNSPVYVKGGFNALNVFLAGPILGTGNWQAEAFGLLTQAFVENPTTSDVHVYNPRRPEFTDLKDFSDETFYDQVEWEHAHLERARGRGVTMFWLANKTIDMPHRNFGLTTLFELGEVIGDNEFILTRPKVVVGIEPGFTNEKYLRYTIAKKAPHVILTSTLEETTQAVIGLLHTV